MREVLTRILNEQDFRGSLDLALKAVAAIGAAVAFAIGLRRYGRTQRWKESEFAAKELDRLTKDGDLHLACQILDWAELELPVPERHLGGMNGQKVWTHTSKLAE